MAIESQHNGYLISDDAGLLDPAAIFAYLSRSYWATNRTYDVVERSLHGSLCLGAYIDAKQIGLARIVSDYATFAYLCDVYVLEEHRGKGIAKALMRAVVAHPKLQNLRRFNLVTQDAHNLYSQFGFVPLKHPERYMEKLAVG